MALPFGMKSALASPAPCGPTTSCASENVATCSLNGKVPGTTSSKPSPFSAESSAVLVDHTALCSVAPRHEQAPGASYPAGPVEAEAEASSDRCGDRRRCRTVRFAA